MNAICRRLLQPDVRAKQRGHWDVMADLSAFVAEVVARNNARDAADDREAERKEFDAKKIATDLFKL